MRTALAACALALSALLAEAAPVPPARPRPRPSPAGSWVAFWGGAEWPTVMLPCGLYVAERAGGPRYEGTWELAGDVLTIKERLVTWQGHGEYYTYRFTLLPGRLRTANAGLRLEPVR